MARKKKASVIAPVSSVLTEDPSSSGSGKALAGGQSAEVACAAALKEFESADRWGGRTQLAAWRLQPSHSPCLRGSAPHRSSAIKKLQALAKDDRASSELPHRYLVRRVTTLSATTLVEERM